MLLVNRIDTHYKGRSHPVGLWGVLRRLIVIADTRTDEEENSIENSQHKTRSVTKAVAKLTASSSTNNRQLAKRIISTTPSVSRGIANVKILLLCC